MISITFLGTTAGMPSKERGHTSLALKYQGEVVLFDCGENAQRQMMHAKVSPMKIKNIFLSHWHADHFAGLPSLIQSLSLKDRKEPLYIYGPKDTKKYVKQILTLGHVGQKYEVIAKEVNPGKIFESDKYSIFALRTSHDVPTLAFKFVEADKPGRFNVKKAKSLGLRDVQFGELQRGKSLKVKGKTIKPSDVMGPKRKGLVITYSSDTRPIKEMVKFAKNSDLLIHECTFTTEHEKIALKVGHSTAKTAAEIAKKARVKELILTHFSPRYTKPDVFLKEAKEVFKNTKISYDLMQIELK